VGNWAANLKHGIGKKTYSNGDSYEGLWRGGKAEGPGRCGGRWEQPLQAGNVWGLMQYGADLAANGRVVGMRLCRIGRGRKDVDRVAGLAGKELWEAAGNAADWDR